MTPIRRKEAVVDGEAAAEAEEEGSVLEVATVSTAPPSSSATAAPAAAAPIEQRRLEAQRHRYAEVWTKDPHGGRHRPVSGAGERGKEGKGFSCPFCTSFSRRKKNEGKKKPCPQAGPSVKGLDPLSRDPASGALLPPPPLGFEKPQRPGPTTNFVGDAMLGAPMQLIGAKLAAADARALSSSVALLCSSSSSSSSSSSFSAAKKPLPLAAPAKKLLLLGGAEETPGEALPLDGPPPVIVVESYGFAEAREVAARLLGRRLPERKRERRGGRQGAAEGS